MKLTLRQLQIFVAVARAGSTIAAAQAISLSQSATSAALNELESLLGTRLFNRAGGRLILNEHGRSMLARARLALDAAQGIERDFGREGEAPGPQFAIAASTTTGNYVLPALIAAYRRKSDARFALEIGNTQQVARAVVTFEADVGFIEGWTSEPDIAVVPWMKDELAIVCSPRHPLARRRRKITLAELGEATWLLREPGSGTREVVEAALLPRLHRLRTAGDLGSAESIKQAAAEGLGLTCLSRFAVADQLKLGRLVALLTVLPPMRRTFHLIRHERRFVSPTLQRFLDFCIAYPRRK